MPHAKDKQAEEKKSLLEVNISFKGVTAIQKIVFARYLAVMLKSGLTISEALTIIADQSTGKFKNIVLSVLHSVQSGNSLASSLKRFPKVFSGLLINSAYAGEASGNLDQNLNNVADQMNKDKELKSKLKAAMVYPVIVISATVVLGLAMAFVVLPKITPLFKGMDIELPWTTRLLIWFSSFIQNNTTVLLVGTAALIILFTWVVKQKWSKPVTHYLILKTPLVKNISKFSNLAVFTRNLSTLLKSGLNIDEAVRITKDTVSNYYFRKCLEKIAQHVGQGTKLSDNLSEYEEYFPKLVTSMIRVGERSGNLEESLIYVAEFYELEVDNSTKALSTAIEPILLIFIGLAVGGMALSIITPIYQITGNIQK